MNPRWLPLVLLTSGAVLWQQGCLLNLQRELQVLLAPTALDTLLFIPRSALFETIIDFLI